MLETLIENYGREMLLQALGGAGAVVVVLLFFWVLYWLWNLSKLLVISLSFALVIFMFPDLAMEGVRAIDRVLGVPLQNNNEHVPGNPTEMSEHIASCAQRHFSRVWRRGDWDTMPAEIRHIELAQVIRGIEGSSSIITKLSNNIWENFNLTDQEMSSFSDSLSTEEYLTILYTNCAISYANMKVNNN